MCNTALDSVSNLQFLSWNGLKGYLRNKNRLRQKTAAYISEQISGHANHEAKTEPIPQAEPHTSLYRTTCNNTFLYTMQRRRMNKSKEKALPGLGNDKLATQLRLLFVLQELLQDLVAHVGSII